MLQMQMFDPREVPTATAEMLADRGLRRAIRAVRRRHDRDASEWPFVEAIGSGWAVDDGGTRYVVLGSVVFELDDLEILNRAIQVAARGVFERLDAGAAA